MSRVLGLPEDRVREIIGAETEAVEG